MHEITGAGFAAEDYRNIKYCSDIGTQKFWKGTVKTTLLLDAYWKMSFTKLHWNKRTTMISSYRVQDKLNAYGETPKASIVFHLELVPEVFQSRSQYSWLCVHIRNPKHQNSSTKMMIEVHTFWNFSPSHRQQHSSPSTFTGLHNKAGHTHNRQPECSFQLNQKYKT